MECESVRSCTESDVEFLATKCLVLLFHPSNPGDVLDRQKLVASSQTTAGFFCFFIEISKRDYH